MQYIPAMAFLQKIQEFARSCEENGITFIGPSSDAVHKLGNKIVSRQIMKKAGIPIVPGALEKMNSDDEAAAEANRLGYPVMLKAAAGGGGRGLRICRNDEELKDSSQLQRKSRSLHLAMRMSILKSALSRRGT